LIIIVRKYYLFNKNCKEQKFTSRLENEDNDNEIDMQGVVEREEHTFNNGAKFKGQWKNEMRHG
jgi:hypothetical protein